MFKSRSEVDLFIRLVGGRVKTCLLLETREALFDIDNILSIKGIDEIHIGLNDLHLSMGLSFMFELLSNGVIEMLSKKIVKVGLKFGFGGVARFGTGDLDSSLILSEHIRLNSSMVILSRDFKKDNVDLKGEVIKIREYFNYEKSDITLTNNKYMAFESINKIVNRLKNSFD
jgi:hypothetical protein